ncbi:BON domain-containing protein [Thermodesulfobacteriota bacterium]
MKSKYKLLFCILFISFLGSGCGTAYKAVVDERNIRTQAQDEKIEMAIRKKIADSDRVKFFDISTYCFYGNVYLVGEYDTSSQKSEAVKLAKKVEGVRSVTEYFLQKKKGDLCGTGDNLGIVAKVKAKLIKDKAIWSTNVKVKGVQCNIVLLGLVGSQNEINKAVLHARSVPGVRKVKSFLKATK